MSVLNENTIIGASAAGGYEIDNSLRFNDDDSAYLSRTPSVAGNRKTWTWSGWVKRGNLGTYQWLVGAGASGTSRSMLMFWGDAPVDGLLLYYTIGSGTYGSQTDAIFRDPSAWYHIAIAVDTTQGTAANRAKIYVNGEQQTTTAYSTGYIPQNTDLHINNNQLTTIGRKTYSAGDSLDGYLAEVNFIDGLALTPDSFGETGDYGEWKPLKYTGAYGTNGFYLNFKNSGSLGNDAAGSNNWTPTNLAATDQMLDSPTNNFATLNPLDIQSQITLSEGNLKVRTNATGDGYKVRGTQQLTGKVYFEGMVGAVAGNIGSWFGIADNGGNITAFNSNRRNGFYYNASDMRKMVDGAVTVIGSGAATAGDVIGLSFDLDNNVFTIKKNNVALLTNQAFTDDVNFSTIVDIYRADSTDTGFILNFGQDSSFAGNKTAQGNSDANGIGDFYYAPPAGFLALCTQNLPDATVVPSEHFNTVLYTGTGAARSITGVGFQPDFTWIKAREDGYRHALYDAVRGVTKVLYSNLTDAEVTDAQGLTAFGADGFSLGTTGNVNNSTDAYVAWNWKAGGSAVSNTNGTITSSVSANPSSGFSIVSYTGTNTDGVTVGHGLSRYPEIVIFKNREATSNWLTMTSMLSNVGYINSTAALTTSRSWFSQSENSTWTSSIGLDAHVACNSADDFIAYAFHSVDGYSKVGSYTGNGSTDGTFVHCGFRPAYVMYKNASGTGNWGLLDNERNTYNPNDDWMAANLSNSESNESQRLIDFLSNGFKVRGTNGDVNTNGQTYIFLAFAESPFKHSNAR